MCHFGVSNSWIQKWQHYFVLTFVWSISKHFECNMCSLLTGMFCASQRSMCLLKVERFWASHGFLQTREWICVVQNTCRLFVYFDIPVQMDVYPSGHSDPLSKGIWMVAFALRSFFIQDSDSIPAYHFNSLRFQVPQMSVAIKKTQIWNWI